MRWLGKVKISQVLSACAWPRCSSFERSWLRLRPDAHDLLPVGNILQREVSQVRKAWKTTDTRSLIQRDKAGMGMQWRLCAKEAA